MIISNWSHVDHGLSEAHKAHILERFADRTEFFIETFTMPKDLAPLDCSLYGPSMGDERIYDAGSDETPEELLKLQHAFYAVRPGRRWASRLVLRPPRKSCSMTVIAGPVSIEDDKTTLHLFTAYGGPLAPREPGDPGNVADILAGKKSDSAAFWCEHALATSSVPVWRAMLIKSDKVTRKKKSANANRGAL
jgi:hypothetical protein